MNIDRFQTYLVDLLQRDQNPAVAEVTTYQSQGGDHPIHSPKIVGADGTTLYLTVVRTSAPGEGSWTEEQIVTKAERGVERLEA